MGLFNQLTKLGISASGVATLLANPGACALHRYGKL